MKLLISYSNRDRSLAINLKHALEKYKFHVWLDEHEILVGDDIAKRLKDEILRSDFVLVVITPNSLNSVWVSWEIEVALNLERQDNRTRILPVLMYGNQVPLLLSNRAFADFRTADLMKQNFGRLIKQLLRAIPSLTKHTDEHEPIETVDMARIGSDIFAAPDIHIIRSPMVGTAYLSAFPGAPPFVSVGEMASVGDTLLIIEAMKILNQIESECSGKVTEILFKDGQPVEYNQPLMLIKLSL